MHNEQLYFYKRTLTKVNKFCENTLLIVTLLVNAFKYDLIVKCYHYMTYVFILKSQDKSCFN